MKTFPAAEAAWSSQLAARLRILQTTSAEDDTDLRTGLLEEEIERALRGVPPAHQSAYLQTLQEAFPEWVERGAPAAGPERADAVPPPALPPETLVTSLVEAARGLSPEARADFGRQLAAAGFGVGAPPAATLPAPAVFELPGEVRARFALAASQSVDAARALRLFGLMTDLTIALDQIAWSVWKQLAPQSVVRREPGPTGDFRKLAALYLSGDPEVASPQLAQLLDKTRKLVAGLLAGLAPAGGAFARGFMARFAPDAIERQAGGGFFTGGEQRNWRAYVGLFGQVTEHSVEYAVLNAIVQYAESALLGPNRPPSPPDPFAVLPPGSAHPGEP